MKKTMLFSSALVALAMLASCQKEEFIETPATATGVTEFTATIEPSTKTAIDASDGKVTWVEGDEITVTDAESKSAVYVAASSGSSTTFTLKPGQTAVGVGPYKATYGDINNQKYSANGANCPLTAQSSTTNFTFSSPYAVVKLTAKSSGGETIKTVVVKYGNSSSVLDCEGQNVTLTSDGVAFYVAVQPSTEAAALSVTFYNTDNKMAKKTRNGSILLDAKDLLPVTLGSFDWTDLKTFKAVYKGDDGTLTFYYDNSLHIEEGVLYDNLPFNASKATDWGYNSNRSKIKSVVIDGSVKDYPFLTSTAYMFYGMTAASSISGAEHLDVSKVTDMSFMFYGFGFSSKSLTDIPIVTDWQTGNVTNMNSLFYGYGTNSDSLAEVPDVSKWSTVKVIYMKEMFRQYGKSSKQLLKAPDVINWNTANVKDMNGMFYGYGYASENFNDVPQVGSWNTAKVEDMSYMFNGFAHDSKVLTEVPAVNGSNWDTKAVTNMKCMFQDYGKSSEKLLKAPDVSTWNTANVKDMNGMFYGYGYASENFNDVPQVGSWNTAKVEDMSYMFNSFAYKSTALTTVPKVDGSNWKTENLKDIDFMFQNYGNGAENICCELNLSGWDLANLSEGSSVFDFTPTEFYVKIPATTGVKSNTDENWFYGTDSNSIKPAFSDKNKTTRHNFNQTNPAN